MDQGFEDEKARIAALGESIAKLERQVASSGRPATHASLLEAVRQRHRDLSARLNKENPRMEWHGIGDELRRDREAIEENLAKIMDTLDSSGGR